MKPCGGSASVLELAPHLAYNFFDKPCLPFFRGRVMILARLIRVCASALLCAGVSLFPGNASADGAGTVVDGRAILKMSKGSNLCALTFDDGPSSHTERLMEILRERGIHATFFVVGKQVKYHPELIVRLQQEGHEIGNHTYSHQKGWGMSLERYTEDVDFANDLIRSDLFRPPYARITPAQARFLGQRYKLVMWDIISRDYNRNLSPRTCLRNVTKYLGPGSIVVFHDSEKSFRNMRYALPRTLEKIRSMGLRCKAIEL